MISKFKITYEDGTTEDVSATVYVDKENGTWIEFGDGGGQVLRVLASAVVRIERIGG